MAGTQQPASRMTLSVARCASNQQVSVRLLEPHENIAINSCAVKLVLHEQYKRRSRRSSQSGGGDGGCTKDTVESSQIPTVLSWRE